MREYETTCILGGAVPSGDVEAFAKKIVGQIEKHSGTIFYSKQEGKKPFSYLMEKQKEGHTLQFDFAAETSIVSELERTFRHDERVLRFLTVKRNEKVDVAARKAELATAKAPAPAAE